MSVKLIAYYLPQYHPIPENDAWWEPGFTEWTNVVKARPLFRHHNQPRLPADLGFYDLRLDEVREQQAEMAKEYGVYAFCYYHYWFGNGRRLLERPFNEVLESGKPDFPFMLCWANQTWKGVWFGTSKGKTLIEQLYPGREDYVAHFRYLEKVFADKRYITIDGKPVFHVYMPLDIPDLPLFVDTFRECAASTGFAGIYLLATNVPEEWDPRAHGFDGVIPNEFQRLRYHVSHRLVNDRHSFMGKVETKLRRILGERKIDERTKPYVIPYHKAVGLLSRWNDKPYDNFPLVLPDWDNSARAGGKSLVLQGSSPELWRQHLSRAVEYADRMPAGKRLVFVKSWNEWAEGNYLEPDQKWGKAYLEVVRDVVLRKEK